MRIFIISILSLFSSLTINAQDWQTDLDKCKKIAQKNNQKIILVFSGSDWCAPCIKLENEIWNSDEFKSYTKDNFVLLSADFPRKKKNKLTKEQQEKNNQLAEIYNKNGFFPFVVVLDSNAKILGATGYEKVTPKEYIKILTSF